MSFLLFEFFFSVRLVYTYINIFCNITFQRNSDAPFENNTEKDYDLFDSVSARKRRTPGVHAQRFPSYRFLFLPPTLTNKKLSVPQNITRLINLTFLGPSHFDYLVTFTDRRLFSRKIAMVYEKLPYIEQSSCGNLQSSYKTVERERDTEREKQRVFTPHVCHLGCIPLRSHYLTVVNIKSVYQLCIMQYCVGPLMNTIVISHLHIPLFVIVVIRRRARDCYYPLL